MAEEERAGEPVRPVRRKEIGGDLIIPLLALAFTLYYLYTIRNLTWEAQINGLVIGSALIALVLIFLARALMARARGQVSLALGAFVRPVRVQLSRGLLLALSIAFIVLIQWLGFTLSVFLFMLSALYVLGVRDRLRLWGIATALSAFGYVLFIALLDTRFPHGVIENLLSELF